MKKITFFLFFLFISISIQQTTNNSTLNITKLRERYKDLTDEEIAQKIKEKEERRARRKLEKEERKKKRKRISFEEAEKIHQKQIDEGPSTVFDYVDCRYTSIGKRKMKK